MGKLQLNPFIALILGVCLISLISCDSATVSDSNQEEISNIGEVLQDVGPSKEATEQFFYAWLADCANDQYKKDSAKKSKAELLAYATTQITNALRNDIIKAVIGKQTLSWGPAVAIGTEGIREPDDYFILNNLI